MKTKKYSRAPSDAKDRANIKPTICYPIDSLKDSNLAILHHARKNLKNINDYLLAGALSLNSL